MFVRERYKTLKDTLLGNKGMHCLLLGKSGIGKTTFLEWLLIAILVESKSALQELRLIHEIVPNEEKWKYQPTAVYVDRENISSMMEL